MEIRNIGLEVFDIEIEALRKTRDSLDNVFQEILDLVVSCKGKVILTGIGKPGHIGRKIAATMSSLGTPAFYLHPAEAMHGDLGMITAKDLVVAISYSGESDEIIRILPNIKWIGAKLIAITSNEKSTLAKQADLVQVLPEFKEADPMGLAPTSSTTVELCYGDALAVAASIKYGFGKENFGMFHPAGALGKKLILKVDDLMAKDDEIPSVKTGTLLMSAISEMSQKGLGIISIVDNDNKLLGIITDGDLRRALQKQTDIYKVYVDDVMTKDPYTLSKNELAVDALIFIKDRKLNSLPIVESNRLVGTITWQQIVRAGIVVT